MTAAIELTGITKRFPGVIANDNVNLTVEKGEIHAICGENGAGKSTLMKILYGLQPPDEGTMKVNGDIVNFSTPNDAIDRGIGMVHQHFMLADNFTVLENIILGAEPVSGGSLDFGKARKELTEIADNAGIDIDLDAHVSELGVGQRQRVEILKVLYRGAKILILDEPTAVLVPQEVDELFVNLRQLVADGATVIFISHKLDEVMAVSDDVTVIRRGTTVASVQPGDVTQSELGELMVGDALPSAELRITEIADNVRLELSSVTVASAVVGAKPDVSDASLTVREGEILGIAGVEGNGQFELCQAILGLSDYEGVIEIDGRDVGHMSTRQRLESGLSYIPFDRHEEGLMLEAPLWENLLLTRDEEPQFGSKGFINQNAVKAATREAIEKFGVLTPDETVPAYALSGGNQQKLIVGRELESNPSVMIAAHPTRGVDVGAQATIWGHLRESRDAGLAVLLVTADLEELVALSDRIVVMFDSFIHAELATADATPEILGVYMTGGRPEAAA